KSRSSSCASSSDVTLPSRKRLSRLSSSLSCMALNSPGYPRPLNGNEEGGVPLWWKSPLQAFRDTIAQHGVNAKHSQPKGVDRDAERPGQFLVMFDFGALLFFVIRDGQFTIFFRQTPHTLFQTGVAALLHLFLFVKCGSTVGFFVKLNVG